MTKFLVGAEIWMNTTIDGTHKEAQEEACKLEQAFVKIEALALEFGYKIYLGHLMIINQDVPNVE
jgi:hypothetical protein